MEMQRRNELTHVFEWLHLPVEAVDAALRSLANDEPANRLHIWTAGMCSARART
jgi:hypothetical protein